MNIDLKRTRQNTDADAQFGEISVNGLYECVSLERVSVIIPAGSYSISLYLSPHFNRLLPLLSVPGRYYIEIHPANWAYQLKGCIAPGTTSSQDSISNSRFAFSSLFNKIQEAIDNGEEVLINVAE